MHLMVFLLLVILAVCVIAQSEGPIVHTRLGLVKGVYTETSQNFLGIPFAQPPVDSLRWKPPVPAIPWDTDVYDATAMKADCAHTGCEYFGPLSFCSKKISEDCLYLNIYTPLDATRSSNLAVMAYLPGGAFVVAAASSIYRGDVFVHKAGVILVTINYRIGVLGFLVTNGGTDQATGNYALKDQRMALEWINENIENFGGDPNKVTLFGQSAGAQSVAYHLTSSKASRLFRAAIMQSEPFSIQTKSYNDAVAQGARVANILQCDDQDILVCLRGKSWQELAAAQLAAGGFEGAPLEYEPWGPHIDDDEVVMSPLNAFLTSNFVPKPLIIGTVSEEGISYIMFQGPIDSTDYKGLLLKMFGENGYLIFNKYPPTPSTESDVRPQMVSVATDFVFACSNLAVARSVARSTKSSNVWHYVYDQPMHLGEWEAFTYCEGRVCHGSEITILFQSAELEGLYEYTPKERDLSDSMIAYWSNFAKSGNPNYPVNAGNSKYPAKARNQNSHYGGTSYLTWPAYGPTKRSMLFKIPENRITKKYNKKYCKFWDKLLFN